MITFDIVDGVCHARIDGELTIYSAAACRDQLQACLADCRAAEFDLSGVGEIDSAGVQLLIQAKREGAARGAPVRLVAHSAAVQEIIDLFQLAGQFGDPMIMNSSTRLQERAR
jgi:anti-sigma B factor antagonist